MADASSANPAEVSDAKRSWPKWYVVVSVFLWLLAWEVIVWFVPVQPRAVIRIPWYEDPDSWISENLAGFSPDGKMIVTTVERTTSMTGQIHLWDANTGQDLGVVGKEGIRLLPNVVYCPQRHVLAECGFSNFDPSVEHNRTYVLYDLIDGKEKFPIRTNLGEDDWCCLCFTPDGGALAFCSNTKDKGDLKLIDVETGQVRAHLAGGKLGDLAELTFSQNGRTLATTETKLNPDENVPDDHTLIVLNTRTGERQRILLDRGEEPLHLVISPDGGKLAAYCLLGNTKLGDIKCKQVKVWDLKDGKQIVRFEAQGFPEFVEDGKALALWHEQGTSLCDSTTGKEYAVAEKSPLLGFMGLVPRNPIPIPSTSLLAVQTSHRSKPSLLFQWCATYLGIKWLGQERDGEELAFLDTRTGKSVAAIVRPRINELRVFPDGTKLALTTIENDQSFIEIWDIPPRKPLRWVLGLLAIPVLATVIRLWRCRKALSGISTVGQSKKL